MPQYAYWVYILTNQYNSVFYTGVTNNILKRTFEHKAELLDGFTKKYKVKKLIYLEEYKDINEAIHREKQLKKWNRSWKLQLIEKDNPDWNDLYDNLV